MVAIGTSVAKAIALLCVQGEGRMPMQSTIQWLLATNLSHRLQDTSWAIPTIQSIHLLAIAALIGSAVAIDLRLAGLFACDVPFSRLFHRYAPWLWTALGVLLATGLLMVIGGPERVLTNWMFWTKMVLVLFGLALSVVMPVLPGMAESVPPSGVSVTLMRLFGLCALGTWVAVIFAGRWIAYIL